MCVYAAMHTATLWRNSDDALMLQKQILMMQQIVFVLMDANEQDFMVQICLANCHSS